uniref:Uncharacterized protein n=1 Tax=Strigamia maritima TaxID=126957 RepID=T1J7I2_STRMM
MWGWPIPILFVCQYFVSGSFVVGNVYRRGMTIAAKDNDESGKLEALRLYLERNAEPKLYRSYNRQFEPAYHVAERDAEDISHRNSFEPEDGEIDAIGNKFIQTEDKHSRSSISQPETIPEVIQKLPVNVQKQARAKLNKDNANSPLAHKSERAPTDKTSDIYFIALVAGCSVAGVSGVIAAGFCWYK